MSSIIVEDYELFLLTGDGRVKQLLGKQSARLTQYQNGLTELTSLGFVDGQGIRKLQIGVAFLRNGRIPVVVTMGLRGKYHLVCIVFILWPLPNSFNDTDLAVSYIAIFIFPRFCVIAPLLLVSDIDNLVAVNNAIRSK